jgi:hypothetical protein
MPAKTPTRKAEMRNLIAEIPEDLFKALKIHSVESDIMMKDLVAQALRQFLKIKEGGEKK